MALYTASALAFTPLASQDRLAIKQAWQTIGPDSCPHVYNFHMHTTSSDGKLQPEQVMEQAVQIGLKGMAITDHHTVRGYYGAQDWLNRMICSDHPLTLPHLWTGIEITAQLLGTDVHILGYAFDPTDPRLNPYLQGSAPTGEMAEAGRVIGAIQQAGGLVVLAHPERYRLSGDQLIPAAVELGIDGVETYYAYRSTNPWQPTPDTTERVKGLSDRYGLFNTCGTDTHGTNLLLRI
ncbi:PHP domain-containing protein [Spirulina subsalsa]|uniref:PHP domain-containing protein n=1 Tax=Spirulina subsalsa TaxID=54311 RepID=UPI0002EF1B44|nr:PHP domain-containing protein [Spirulina subsalsa]